MIVVHLQFAMIICYTFLVSELGLNHNCFTVEVLNWVIISTPVHDCPNRLSCVKTVNKQSNGSHDTNCENQKNFEQVDGWHILDSHIVSKIQENVLVCDYMTMLQ